MAALAEAMASGEAVAIGLHERKHTALLKATAELQRPEPRGATCRG